MNILVTGASGFIASEIITQLLAAGHQVTGCARNTAYVKTIFPTIKVIPCDFIHDLKPEDWLPRLEGIDVVINAVGVFFHPNKKIIWAIHYDAPKALFDACVQKGIKKVIHVSALGIEKSAVNYSQSKKAIDEYLLKLPLQASIIRPSFVYGKGSYGGSSLFRGLAGIPWVTPVPGKGLQLFQPIHIDDLARGVLALVEKEETHSQILVAASKEQVTLNDILSRIRAWLGFPKAMLLHIPTFFIRFGGYFGDYIPYSTINSDSYQLLMQDNITSPKEAEHFADTIGFTPRNFDEGVTSQPSTVQDHWHAKLFFLKPLLKLSLVFMWIFTALCSLFSAKENSFNLLSQIGIQGVWQPIALYTASVLDGLLGLALLFDYKVNKVLFLQMMVMLVYTLIITLKLPYIWLEPFGPIAKNIPILAATLVYWAIAEDR